MGEFLGVCEMRLGWHGQITLDDARSADADGEAVAFVPHLYPYEERGGRVIPLPAWAQMSIA